MPRDRFHPHHRARSGFAAIDQHLEHHAGKPAEIGPVAGLQQVLIGPGHGHKAPVLGPHLVDHFARGMDAQAAGEGGAIDPQRAAQIGPIGLGRAGVPRIAHSAAVGMAETHAADGHQLRQRHVRPGRRRAVAGEHALGFETHRASFLERRGPHPRGLRNLERSGVFWGSGRGCRTIQCVADLRPRLQRGRKRHGDGTLEDMRPHAGSPGGDAHRIHHPVLLPSPEPRQLLLERDGGRQVLLEVRHHLLGVEVRREATGRVVARMGIGHVAGQHALEARRLHGAQTHGFAQQAHLGVEADVDQMGQAVFLAEGVDLGLRVGHPIVRADHQVRMHAVPTIMDAAPLGPAGAAPGIGHRRAVHRHHRGHRHLRQLEHRLPLRSPDIIVHHIARTQEDRHAQIASRREGLVDPRHEGIHPHRGRLAPVEVPDVHRHHPDARRVDHLVGHPDPARLGIPCLQAPADGHGTDPGHQSQADHDDETQPEGAFQDMRGHAHDATCNRAPPQAEPGASVNPDWPLDPVRPKDRSATAEWPCGCPAGSAGKSPGTTTRRRGTRRHPRASRGRSAR